MHHPLASVEEVKSRISDLRLFDIRWSLTNPSHGEKAFLEGHLPGAMFVDLDTQLSDPGGDGGRHPLPTTGQFAETLGRLGLTHSDDVVVYDDAGGAIASRMWWMLKAIGHEKARVLDGGIQAWIEEGYQLESGPAEKAIPTQYLPSQPFTGHVSHDELADRQLVDVRGSRRYTGEHEPVDPAAGHIPGAVNLPTTGNLKEDLRFASPESLRERFQDLDDKVVVYCGSGVNACHTALAIILAGGSMPDIYIGSFSDWSTRGLPVRTGPAP